VDRLHGELAAIMKQPDVQALFQKQALEPTSTTPEEFARFLRVEYDKWGKVIKSLKIQ
jgi:tripartite-type tricarboxylate transporter receptor subunit TctC